MERRPSKDRGSLSIVVRQRLVTYLLHVGPSEIGHGSDLVFVITWSVDLDPEAEERHSVPGEGHTSRSMIRRPSCSDVCSSICSTRARSSSEPL